MRLAMKPGVSLQRTTPLPSRTSANASMRLDRLGPGRRAGDHLQQPHVARRVEEMGDQEVAAEASPAAPSSQLGQRDGRGVRGDDRARLPDGLEPRVERLLDVERPRRSASTIQSHVGEQRRGRPRGCPAVTSWRRAAEHERRRLGLRAARWRRAASASGRGPGVRHDVEQQHRHAGIGDVRGDARRPSRRRRSRPRRMRTRAMAQTASSTVAMPWPPPMHWVASA